MRPIDKASSTPYYLQLAEVLRREIGERRSPQEVYQLPSENELAASLGIARATVRRALDVLERDSWIYRQKGKGSLAAVRRVEHELTQLISTTEDMRKRGWDLTTRVVSLDRRAAPRRVVRDLELPEDAPCYKLRRLRMVEGEPISIQSTYLSAALCAPTWQTTISQLLCTACWRPATDCASGLDAKR